jgi:hypothetical protein
MNWGRHLLRFVGLVGALVLTSAVAQDARTLNGSTQDALDPGAVDAKAVRETQAAFDRELAYRYAPIHYQDTDSSNYRADYLSAVDYDGDWDMTNNWDNLQKSPQPAVAYYSVVESCSHWFIVYAFYHPRDWDDGLFDEEHENDMEGLLMIVHKNGERFGTLQAMVTAAHTDFYSFTVPGSGLSSGNEDIDGTLSTQLYDGELHPKTTQEAKGHGLKAWPYAGDFRGNSNEDGIIYFPSKTSGHEPASGNDRHGSYALINLFEHDGLWSRQMNRVLRDQLYRSRNIPDPIPEITYAHFGTFKGNDSGGCGDWPKSCKENGANTPWGWDDEDDGPIYRGEMALDPAHLVSHYFRSVDSISENYIRNRYLQDLAQAGIHRGTRFEPWAWPFDPTADLPKGWPWQLDPQAMFTKLVKKCVRQ